MRDELVAIRNLLSNPDHWTKLVMARDLHGNSCGPNQDKAHCFCIIGAVRRVTLDTDTRDAMMDHLESCIVTRTNGQFDLVMDFNDDADTTHSQVLALIDFAIAA